MSTIVMFFARVRGVWRTAAIPTLPGRARHLEATGGVLEVAFMLPNADADRRLIKILLTGPPAGQAMG